MTWIIQKMNLLSYFLLTKRIYPFSIVLKSWYLFKNFSLFFSRLFYRSFTLLKILMILWKMFLFFYFLSTFLIFYWRWLWFSTFAEFSILIIPELKNDLMYKTFSIRTSFWQFRLKFSLPICLFLKYPKICNDLKILLRFLMNK